MPIAHILLCIRRCVPRAPSPREKRALFALKLRWALFEIRLDRFGGANRRSLRHWRRVCGKAIPADDIINIAPVMTMVGGRIVFDSSVEKSR